MIDSLGFASRPLCRCPVKPLGRDVRRVGLHHQRVQRQIHRKTPNGASRLVGHGSAKSQLEAQFDEFTGLDFAAVERMSDAAKTIAITPQLAQMLEQAIRRLSDMQDHRQTMLFSQPQLGTVEELLALAQGTDAELGHKKIQTNLAHGHQIGVVAVLAQLLVQQIQV